VVTVKYFAANDHPADEAEEASVEVGDHGVIVRRVRAIPAGPRG